MGSSGAARKRREAGRGNMKSNTQKIRGASKKLCGGERKMRRVRALRGKVGRVGGDMEQSETIGARSGRHVSEKAPERLCVKL
jgi:hypothetical protein